MKFSIHGFYQPRAVELGLTNDDLLVLRWFVDFAGTEKMKTLIEQDGIYYWVNYSTVLKDLPVLRITKDTLRRKHFVKLCECGILKHKHIKQGGSFSYYAYGLNYDTLVYLQDTTPTGNSTEGTGKSTEGCVKTNGGGTGISTEGYVENNGTKINLLNNTSINNKSIKDNKNNKQLEEEFETLWSMYPNKQGKAKSLEHYIKSRTKEKIEYDVILEGLKKYLLYCEQNKDWYRPKNGSTWFNYKNKCWNDEYDAKENNTNSSSEQNFVVEEGGGIRLI